MSIAEVEPKTAVIVENRENQRRKYWRFVELLAGVASGLLLVTRFSAQPNNAETFGLGDQTASYQATDGTHLVHVIHNTDQEEQSLIEGWEARGEKPVCLLLGYSQAHSINKMKAGQVTYTQMLFDRHKSFDVLCQSIPNANMSEYLAVFAYWKSKLPVKAVILPACLDKLRDDNLRPEYLQNLGYNNFRLQRADEVSQDLNRQLSVFPKRQTQLQSLQTEEEDYAGLKETTQDVVERRLNHFLNLHLSAWRRRADLRGEVFEWMYLFRNSVLGISSNTKRKVIPARYVHNMQALESLLDFAQQENVSVLVYVPPIRNDLPTPYDDQQYRQFKAEVQAAVNRHAPEAHYENIENLVPGEFWGDLPTTDLSGKRQPDFMHFRYEGHQLTADALDPSVTELMK